MSRTSYDVCELGWKDKLRILNAFTIAGYQ